MTIELVQRIAAMFGFTCTCHLSLMHNTYADMLEGRYAIPSCRYEYIFANSVDSVVFTFDWQSCSARQVYRQFRELSR